MEWFRDYHYDEDWDAIIDIEQIKGWIYKGFTINDEKIS